MEQGPLKLSELARLILEGTADGIAVLDGRLRVVVWNPGMEAQTGVAGSEAVGRSIVELFPELPASATWCALQEAARGEGVSLVPWQYEVRSTGRRGWARLEVLPLQGAGGAVLVTFRDITALAESRKELEAANALLDVIVRTAPVAIVAFDRRRVVTFWNPGAERIFGWTAEEAVGRPAPHVEGGFEHEHRTLFEGAARSGAPLEAELTRWRKGGATVEVSLSLQAVRGASGEYTGYTAIYQDISARKAAERALRASETRLERAQKVARMGTYEARFEKCPPGGAEQAYWSPGVFEILGLDAKAVEPGREALLAVTHPEDRERLLEPVRREYEIWPAHFVVEHRVVLADGETRVVRHHVEMTRTEGGGVLLTGAVQDITEYRRLEEQLLQAQKLEGIGQLAGGIAHDFNNLLTVINGYADLLARDAQVGEAVREGAATILSAGQRAAELTQQLLAFSRRQILQPKAVSLNEVLGDLRRMLDRLLGANIEVVEHLEPRLGLVYADAGQVQQVMLNIIVNARDAMPGGGRLTIETANVEIDGAYVDLHPDVVEGPYVCLAIADTGAGMDEKTKARIFEPFFTTKEMGRGTGLGLATVYGIVKQSRGFVWVYSEPGRGTTIKVYLPVIEGARAAEEEAHEGEEAPVAAGTTILLAEDQEHVRTFAARVLRARGFRVLEAASGQEALEAAAREKGRIDLLLTDVVMPGMAARALEAAFRAARPEARILYMSGYTENVIVHEGILDAGIELVAKPFTPAELVRRVERVLEAEV